METIHLSREELYDQPLATGSPPLLESEASESMKRYVCNFFYFSKKIVSFFLLKIEFIFIVQADAQLEIYKTLCHTWLSKTMWGKFND